MRVLGVILAGGDGARLGGVDKALEVIAGRTCLAWCAERLGPQVAALALVAAGPADAYAGFAGPVLRDAGWPAREGPLAGVLAGLRHAAGHGFDAALTVAVDAPFFPTDLAARLAAAGGPAAAASGRQVHPVFALWPVAVLAPLQDLWAAGERSPRFALERLGAASADFPVSPFANLNTPEDRAVLEALAGSLAP